METIAVVLIIAVIYFIYQASEENRNKISKISNSRKVIEEEISSKRIKYGGEKWDILFTHYEAPGVSTNTALREFFKSKPTDFTPNASDYYKFLKMMITNGEKYDPNDFLQKFDNNQLKNFVNYSQGDFPLFFFQFLYLSYYDNYGILIMQEKENLHLLIDIIYYKTRLFEIDSARDLNIITLNEPERFSLANHFIITWKDL